MRGQQDFKHPIVLHVESPSCFIHDRRLVDPIRGGA